MRRRIILLLLSLIALVFLGSLQNLAESERVAHLEVLDAQPSPAGLLALDEAITFTFNRRVDCVEAEAAFTWQPAIRGRVTCDEYSLAFEPLDQYERDTSYTFAFAPPLQAKDGAPLLDPYRADLFECRLSGSGGSLPAARKQIRAGRFRHHRRIRSSCRAASCISKRG